MLSPAGFVRERARPTHKGVLSARLANNQSRRPGAGAAARLEPGGTRRSRGRKLARGVEECGAHQLGADQDDHANGRPLSLHAPPPARSGRRPAVRPRINSRPLASSARSWQLRARFLARVGRHATSWQVQVSGRMDGIIRGCSRAVRANNVAGSLQLDLSRITPNRATRDSPLPPAHQHDLQP